MPKIDAMMPFVFFHNPTIIRNTNFAGESNCCCEPPTPVCEDEGCQEVECSGCCGDGSEGPDKFLLSLGEGEYAGGRFLSVNECNCCDCVQQVLPAFPQDMDRHFSIACRWETDSMFANCDEAITTPGTVFLDLEPYRAEDGSCKVRATVTHPVAAQEGQTAHARWRTEDFDCEADSENPNILTAIDTGGCGTIPQTATVWKSNSS